jgi:hypothetical protein
MISFKKFFQKTSHDDDRFWRVKTKVIGKVRRKGVVDQVWERQGKEKIAWEIQKMINGSGKKASS